MAKNTIYGARWRVVNQLGEGGQSVVYRVVDERGEHEGEFALKRVLNSRRPDRFEAEVRASTALKHESIIPVVDNNVATFQSTNESPFLVMHIAPGRDLSKRKRLYRASLDTTIRVARQICAGLHHAHANGIIHRDVKPENILFKASDSHDLWLADFGICLLSEAPRHTEAGEKVGPAYFMAPELELGGRLDCTAAADVYSLGKVIFYMISGGLVIPRERVEETDPALWENQPPRFGLLKALLFRMVCPLNHRIATVADVEAELTRIENWEKSVAGAPVNAQAMASLSRLRQRVANTRTIVENNRAARQLEKDRLNTVTAGVRALLREKLLAAREVLHDPDVLQFEVSELSGFRDAWFEGPERVLYRVIDGYEVNLVMPHQRFRMKHVIRFGVAHTRLYSGQVRDRIEEPAQDVELTIFPFYSGYASGAKKPMDGVGAKEGGPGTLPRVVFSKDDGGSVKFRLSEWPASADRIVTLVENTLETLLPGLERRSS